MQRERIQPDDRQRTSGDGPPDGETLKQHRQENDELLQATDSAFDTINSLHAQNYLHQNLQTGGQ